MFIDISDFTVIKSILTNYLKWSWHTKCVACSLIWTLVRLKKVLHSSVNDPCIEFISFELVVAFKIQFSHSYFVQTLLRFDGLTLNELVFVWNNHFLNKCIRQTHHLWRHVSFHLGALLILSPIMTDSSSAYGWRC